MDDIIQPLKTADTISSGKGVSRSALNPSGSKEEEVQCIADADTSNFTEDIGLMESTIRKVKTYLLTCVNHIFGLSEDIECDIFKEKVWLPIYLVCVICESEKECVCV